MLSLNCIVLFILSINIFLIFYPFLFYPILLFFISKIKRQKYILQKPKNSNISNVDIDNNNNSIDNINKIEQIPDLTVVIAAYNEEKNIADAIISLYEDGYDHNRLNVIVGIDGYSDNTDIEIQKLQKIYPNLKYYILEHNGKNAVLNNIIAKVNTDYYLTMDADMRVRPNTLKKMVMPLVLNDNIGAVLANMEKINIDKQDNAGSTGEKLYQKFETYLRKKESDIKTTVNAFGFMAMRTNEFKKIPSDLMCDDFFAILKTNSLGKNVLFLDELYVKEISRQSLTGEVQRRIRMVAGSLATIKYFKHLLLPNFGFTAFAIWSHKCLRYLLPIYLIIVLLATICMPKSGLKYFLVYFQLFFYALSIIGIYLEKKGIRIFIFKLLSFFLMMNYGFIRGILRFCFGFQNSSWQRR